MNPQVNSDAEDAAKVRALQGLAENFGKPFSKALLAMWLELLAPYPAAAVNQAVLTVIDRYEFKTIPPFAVLKTALNDLQGTSDKTLEVQAVAEWNLLIDAMAVHGSARKPQLHPTTDYVLGTMGGWAYACCYWTSKDNGMDFRRKDFISLWVESHGRVDQMRLGARGVARALASGQDRRVAGMLPVGATVLKAIAGGSDQ